MLFKICINKKIINKPFKNERVAIYAKAKFDWENSECDKDAFINSIKLGYAFCPQMLKNSRETTQFKGTNYIGIDIDTGIDINEMLSRQFIKENASFIYTTPNHTDESHRFRIIFVSQDYEWANAKLYRKSVTRLMKSVGGTDESCKDAARMFYGNENAHIYHIDSAISLSLMKELTKENEHRTFVKSHHKLHDHRLLLALSKLPVYEKNNAELVRVSLYVENHFGNGKGQDFYVRHWENGENTSIDIGRYLKDWAIPNDAIPDSLEILSILSKHHINYDSSLWRKNFRKEYFDTSFLDIESLSLDKYKIVGIKSPMGTGKTTFLRTFLESCSFDFIAHRISLVNKLAMDFKAVSYHEADKNEYYEKFVSTLHSYHKFDHTADSKDVTVIDEVNQVLRCLASDENVTKNRLDILKSVKDRMKNSGMIIILDADLTEDDMSIVCEMSGISQSKALMIINTPKMSRGVCYNYEGSNPEKIIEQLKESALKGKKCYVSCVARSTAEVAKGFLDLDDLHEEDLNAELIKHGLKTLLVSSTTRLNKDVNSFLMNPNVESMKYDVVIATPTIGSGVSIDNGYFDEVFHIGKADVITLSDQLQMPARVRRCPLLRVWFESRAPRQKVTDPTILYQRYLAGTLYAETYDIDAITSIHNIVADSYDLHLKSNHDLLARMLATYEAEAAYGNWGTREKALKRLASDGWKIESSEASVVDEVASKKIKGITKSLNAKKIDGILAATDISALEYLTFLDHKSISQQNIAAMLKFRIKDTLRLAEIDSKTVHQYFNKAIESRIQLVESMLCDEDKLRDLDTKERGLAQIDRAHPFARKKLTEEFLRSANIPFLKLMYSKTTMTYRVDDLLKLSEFIQNHVGEITTLLNITIHKTIHSGEILGKLLNKLMIRTKRKVKRVGKDEFTSIYECDPSFCVELTERRKKIKSRLSALIETKEISLKKIMTYKKIIDTEEKRYLKL